MSNVSKRCHPANIVLAVIVFVLDCLGAADKPEALAKYPAGQRQPLAYGKDYIGVTASGTLAGIVVGRAHIGMAGLAIGCTCSLVIEDCICPG